MSPRKVCVGLVGCGSVAHIHAKALKKINVAEIKTVVDIDAKKAEEFANKYNINKWYTSNYEMLKNEDIQVVNILTNPQTHAKLAIEAMNAGKHVLVEKPMCVTLREAEAMLSASERNKVKLFPLEEVVFTPAVQGAIRIINSGKVGELLNVHAYMSVITLVEQMERDTLPAWMYSLPGGIFGELIPHILYTTLVLLNEPVESIHVSYLNENREKFKGVCPFKELRVALETKNRYATMVMSARSVSKHEVQTITIDCERAKITIDLPTSILLIRNYNIKRFQQLLQPLKSFITNYIKIASDVITLKLYPGISWKIANEKFLNSIIYDTPPPFTGRDGVEWVRVTEQIWKECSLVSYQNIDL